MAKALFISKPLKMEPLGLMYLSAAAKQTGNQVKLTTWDRDLTKVMREFHPDVIAYSVMTGDQKAYLEINSELKKEYKFLSVFGGPHPTFFPEIIQQEGVDVVCRGEGEEAFRELLNLVEDGNKNELISSIPNLWVKTPQGVVKNPLRPFADINLIPSPDRTLISGIESLANGPIVHFMASRGCPFNCSYCFNEKYSELYKGNGQRVRFRSPELVVKEIEETLESSPSAKFVYFQDDTFTLRKDWLQEFSKLYQERVKMPFHCHVRANTCDEDKVQLLKQAGCFSVHIASETADDRLRNEVLNRGMSQQQIYRACTLLRKHGIRYMLQNMIGLPTGTLDDDIKTLEMNIQCQPEYAWVSIFQPYPGTALGESSREKGLYLGDFSDIGSNFYDGSQLNFSEQYKNQLVNLQRLFAFIVENPQIHSSGLSRFLIDLERTPKVREEFNRVYDKTRAKADERLYGFKL